MYEDKALVCKVRSGICVYCRRAGEFYAERGFPERAQRCKGRDARKNAARGPVFTATCVLLAAEARVPFEPQSPTVRYIAANASPKCASRG